jgi:hypothetical protein
MVNTDKPRIRSRLQPDQNLARQLESIGELTESFRTISEAVRGSSSGARRPASLTSATMTFWGGDASWTTWLVL